MAISERKYDALIISSLIVLFSILWMFGTINFIKEMQKNNQIIGFAVSDNAINQTQPQEEVYSVRSYTVFYLSIIFILIVVAIISLTLIVPRIKKYT